MSTGPRGPAPRLADIKAYSSGVRISKTNGVRVEEALHVSPVLLEIIALGIKDGPAAIEKMKDLTKDLHADVIEELAFDFHALQEFAQTFYETFGRLAVQRRRQ